MNCEEAAIITPAISIIIKADAFILIELLSF
jgi:hypothetical protein